ncbi:MAG: TIGR04086 family membrane protein [Ktedonobacteraceae bacterium]
MQDSESNYPLHQPRKNGHHRPPDDDLLPGPTDDQFEDEEEPAPRPRVGARFIAPSSRSAAVLPSNRLKNSLFAGAIAGVLCIGQSIIITLANASTYHAYEIAKDTTTKNALAFTIFGYGILTFLISMLICLVTGFIVGRMAVERRLAFLAGFVAGFLVYIVSFIINYIPNYPGSNASSGSSAGAATGGIILIIVFVIVWGVVGGLVSLLGGWLATRKHPHYVE